MRRIAYRDYLVVILLIVLAFSSVDRLALGLVLQDIKRDLALSDTQLGFLTGIAFALFYALMGLPLARWADRGNRVTIITLTTAVWSAAVALCALAGNFLQLLSIRIAVAVGEAGCMPVANSLIADHFNRAERPRATSRYLLGGPASSLIGLFLAGWLNEYYGWRITFILLGLPGVALALVARLTLREPRRGKSVEVATPALPQLGFLPVCAHLWRTVTFRRLLLSYAIASFFGYGLAPWLPAFFIRSFAMGTGELGTWLAVVLGTGSLVGVYVGGEWAARHAPNNEQLQINAMVAAKIAAGLAWMGVYVSPNPYSAFALAGLAMVCGSLPNGPLFALLQTLVPERMRAQSIALVFAMAHLIGMGLGPLAIGTLSDALRPVFGEDSLRYALLLLSPGFFLAAWYLWRGGRTVTHDLKATERDHAAQTHERFAPPTPPAERARTHVSP